MSTPFGELKNAQGERLDYACQPAVGPQPGERLVVIGHGVTANKDRAWATTLADALDPANAATLNKSRVLYLSLPTGGLSAAKDLELR